MEEQIKKILKDEVDPVLSAHYGGSVLTRYDDGVAAVKLTGNCASCPAAQQTIEDVVKEILMEHIPELKDVILDTSVSEDLLDMARQILNKNK